MKLRMVFWIATLINLSGYAQAKFPRGTESDYTSKNFNFETGIGRGQSSKPGNGLHMKFPQYTYANMVAASYQLLTEHLGVNHLRLTLGPSMSTIQAGTHSNPAIWGDYFQELVALTARK